MQYRYRVFGKIEQSFILRGAYFAVGSEIDFYITESELYFVKEMCKIDRIVDFQKPTKTENSMSNIAEITESKEKAVMPEKPTKRQYNKRKAEQQGNV